MSVNRVAAFPRRYPSSMLSNRRELAELDLGFVDALKRLGVPWTEPLLKLAHDARRALDAEHRSEGRWEA